jgi:membrane protein
MGKQKTSSGILHRFFIWITSYLRIAIIDLYKVYIYLTVPKRRAQLVRKSWVFLRILYNRIISEGILKESASLTYITLLGFVPFVTFLVLIAPDLPFLNLGDKFRDVVAKNFIPGSANAILNFVDELFLRRAGFNIFNFVILLITSYSLFTVIRDTFDRILSMQLKASQDMLTQFVKFFGTIVFGLMIMVLLFSSSSIPLISRLLKYPLLQWLMVIVPFILQFLAMMFLYMLLPSVRIKRSSLIRGAFWTTVIWVMAKSLFDVYIYNLTNVQAVYGVLAALPIFLMWIYLNWVIILGGIVLVSVIDSGLNNGFVRKEPQKAVRITLEMFSDSKMNQRLEGIISKHELKNLIETIDEEGDK